MLHKTNSSILTGLVAMSAYLPALGLYAGVVIDKINRLWFGHNNILLIGGLAFLRSCFNSLFQPAFNSFIPMLFLKKVGTHQCPTGNIRIICLDSGSIFYRYYTFNFFTPKSFFIDSISFIATILFSFVYSL